MATAASAALMGAPASVPVASASDAEVKTHLPLLRSYRRPTERPNVLFIAIDDLNDWIGCLGGHPNTKTPNIDRLARRGALFERAYCASALCNPSRTAVMTGVSPFTSGIYHNQTYYRDSPYLENPVSLPQYFKQQGYRVTGSGKMNCGFADPPSWHSYWPSLNQELWRITRPPDDEFPLNGLDLASAFFDWGQLDVANEEMGDWMVSDKVVELLSQDYDRPFFIGCGFFDTHQPFYAPPDFFAMHQPDEIMLPEIPAFDDLEDLPWFGRKLATGMGEHDIIIRDDQWRAIVRAYLACISLVDACVGRVLNALDNSPHRDNTIVVLWSDHGWHLGEKTHWRKRTLWEDATRNVLLFAGPGIEPGRRVTTPVSLMDIFPTLIDLCGLEAKSGLQGHNLRPLFDTPQAVWSYPAITTVVTNWDQLHFSVRRGHWRYIQYADGKRELYDRRTDPNEWYNLSRERTHADVMDELSQWIPEYPAYPIMPVDQGSAYELSLIRD